MKGSKEIGSYKVERKALVDQPILQLLPYSVGKFRFRYDSYITTHGYDMHSLIIKDFTVDEAQDYTIKIQDFSHAIMLRHFGKLFALPR